MANLNFNTDSPISRRIVRAFLDFLNSVEPAPGVDPEGLEVARECLTEVFKLDSSSVDDQAKPHLLIDIFRSLGANELQESRTESVHGATSVDAPSSSFTQNAAEVNHAESSKSQGEDWTKKPNASGISRDELSEQFFAALAKIQFFRTMPDGNDDLVQLEKATRLFNDALTEMERSGCQTFNINNLAESLKSQGNRAMQSKHYSDAIELYNCAIALCENAVYYCNRAAAYTQIHKYSEAIRDCVKSIEIDPNYSKAYSRLGLAYYAQGNFSDAINKGFKKALQLDPNNESVKENIRVAEQKLREEQQRWTERGQNASSASRSDQESQNQSTGGPRSHATPSPFTSMPFNPSALPPDFASMIMNMAANAANAYQGQHSQDGHGEDSHVDGSDEPEIRIGGNISMNFGEQMPEELTGALRSVMEMFTGAASHQNTQDPSNGRPEPN